MVVESIQKLSSPTSQLSPVNYQLVIVDEAHHALAKTYRMLWERWPEAKFLGLTATPCRLSGEAFTDLFEVLLQSWTIQTFIDKGWLSDFEYVSAAPDNRMMQQVRGLRKRGLGGDYQEKEMCAVLDVPESIEHLYKTYKSFADGKKGIVYAINQQHARHIDAYYREQGVNCCVIDSRTPAKERQRMVEDYRNGRIDVLVNVDIFSNGFDCPEVEFIQLARPTLSLSLYLQQVGRGMRKLGHCTAKKVIQLSRNLMFLPEPLVRYIICHELAHLTHMNHSPQFHALCDRYTGGHEKELEKQLRHFHFPILK